jgi:hypothetical protein
MRRHLATAALALVLLIAGTDVAGAALAPDPPPPPASNASDRQRVQTKPDINIQKTADGADGMTSQEENRARPASTGSSGPARPVECVFISGDGSGGMAFAWKPEVLGKEGAPAAGLRVRRICYYLDSPNDDYLVDYEMTWPGWDAWFAAPEAPEEIAIRNVVTFSQRLPLPEVRTFPALDRQVVNVKTWFRVDNYASDTYVPRDTPGITVTMMAEPVRSEWVVGGKVVETCAGAAGAGRVWEDTFHEGTDTTPCGHAFFRSTSKGEADEITVRVTYAMSWSASDGRSGALGEVRRERDYPMHVREIQAVGR